SALESKFDSAATMLLIKATGTRCLRAAARMRACRCFGSTGGIVLTGGRGPVTAIPRSGNRNDVTGGFGKSAKRAGASAKAEAQHNNVVHNFIECSDARLFL